MDNLKAKARELFEKFKNRRSSLDRKMDKLRQREEEGNIKVSKLPRSLRKFMNNKLAVFGAVTLIIIVVMCVFAPLFTKYDPLNTTLTIDNYLKPPSSDHILGTDKVGRDIFAAILYGGRISILVGLGSALGTGIIGVALGSYAGYKGGWLDKTIMRISEIFMAFPQIILVLLLVTILGQSLWNLLLIFIFTGWTRMYRMTRAQMLSLREEEYVQSLKAFGLSPFVIVFKHILPNALGPIAVNVTLTTAGFVLQETALSFLGLGVPLNIPTWGNIINAAKQLSILRNNWWIYVPVGTVISLFILSINFIGDGFRDSTDPAQQG